MIIPMNLIFDFDGTLADTSKLIVTTMQKSIEECGLPFKTEDEIKSTIGVRLEEIPSILWPEIQNLNKKLAATYRKNFEIIQKSVQVSLFPGVKQTLEYLSKNGIKMAVATSRSTQSVMDLAKKLDIIDYFEYILGGDKVTEGKPSPESIFKILEVTDKKVKDTLMVGDMPVDILMAKNAGTKSCGVTYGNSNEIDLKRAGADYIITQFTDLPKII